MEYIVSIPCLVKILALFMMSRLPQSFRVNSILLRADITRFYMYIYISNIFCQAQLCTNDYFAPNSISTKRDGSVFPLSSKSKTDEVEHPWCISFHGYLLGVLRSNFSNF